MTRQDVSRATVTADPGPALLSEEGIQDPYPIYDQMREVDAVLWSHAFQMWLVTGHRAVRHIYRSHDDFTTVGTTAGASLSMLSSEVRQQVPTVVAVESAEVLNVAPPERHAVHRRLVSRPLSVRRLEQRRDWVEAFCATHADGLAARHEVDLVADFCTPLAYGVILDLFGSPTEHLAVYQDTSEAFFAFIAHGGGTPKNASRYEAALVRFKEALESVYDEHRRRPPDDTILSSLLRRDGGKERLSDLELFGLMRKFFAAGHENLIYTIAVAIMELLRHPDQLAAVRDDPSLAAPAYEEAVRWEAPNQGNARTVVSDTVLEGQHMRSGDRVMNMKAAADRDPSVWTAPNVFDIIRDQHEPEGGSVAFGQGIHFCVGAGLARLVGPMAVNALLRRLPDMRLPDGWSPRWQSVPLRRKLTALPLIVA